MRFLLATLVALMLVQLGSSMAQQTAERRSSDPVLYVKPGQSILGESLPPGSYRVVPVLKPGQVQAEVTVTLKENSANQSTSGDEPDSGKTPVQGTAPEPKTAGNKQAEAPVTASGTEFDCEYGLPRRKGATALLQLQTGDLPSGAYLDANLNFNQPGEVHQWILFGEDRKNRIEVSITEWTPKSTSYYNWKHGMLATGEFSQTDVPIGYRQLYVEEKKGCNKQLIMQVGNYMVEMHRPPVEGVNQKSDIISRDQFLQVAKGCESKIAEVAGIPPDSSLQENPTSFNWNGVIWPVEFKDGLLRVRGAGGNAWGKKWITIASGISQYRGRGTGAGPVVVYTKDRKKWIVVLARKNHKPSTATSVRRLFTALGLNFAIYSMYSYSS